MDVRLEGIKEKLRKLIAHEESARELGNLEEANAFASKIQHLLIEYELEVHEVLGGAKNRVYNVIQKDIDTELITGRHESNWIAFLMLASAEAFFCKGILLGKTAATPRVRIYGEESNIEMLEYVVSNLSTSIRTLSRRAFADYHGPTKKNTWLRGFFKGACHGIRIRLIEDKKKEEAKQPQVQGLVLDKMAAIKRFMDGQGLALKSATSRTTKGVDGMLEGVKAGKNIDIRTSPPKSIGSGPKQLNP